MCIAKNYKLQNKNVLKTNNNPCNLVAVISEGDKIAIFFVRRLYSTVTKLQLLT